MIGQVAKVRENVIWREIELFLKENNIICNLTVNPLY